MVRYVTVRELYPLTPHRHPKLMLQMCHVTLLSHKSVSVTLQATVETLYEK